MVQLRNLNLDPEIYLETVGESGRGEPMGIVPWLEELGARFPKLQFGYFNPPRKNMTRRRDADLRVPV